MSTRAARSLNKTQKRRIPEDFLAHLRDDLFSRRIDNGIDRLARHRRALEPLVPAHENAAALVGFVAQWVDVGFDRPQLVKDLLSHFSQTSRASLPLGDYLHLRMAGRIRGHVRGGL